MEQLVDALTIGNLSQIYSSFQNIAPKRSVIDIHFVVVSAQLWLPMFSSYANAISLFIMQATTPLSAPLLVYAFYL